MSKLKVKTLLLFLFVILPITVTTYSIIAQEKLDYSAGYIDGQQAAQVDAKKYGPHGIFDLAPVCHVSYQVSVPEERMLEIQNKPAEYQRGYIESYKESIGHAYKRMCSKFVWIRLLLILGSAFIYALLVPHLVM